jgi:hypothetical protein
MHARQQIRDAVATICTGLTTTGARAYRSRAYPMASAELPGLCVYTTQEASQPEIMRAPRRLLRELSIVVECYARATDAVDATLDTIAAEVETAIGTDPTLGSKVRRVHLSQTETMLMNDGEQPVGVARLTFTAEYATYENAPATLAN